jgi:hypothetical protein
MKGNWCTRSIQIKYLHLSALLLVPHFKSSHLKSLPQCIEEIKKKIPNGDIQKLKLRILKWESPRRGTTGEVRIYIFYFILFYFIFSTGVRHVQSVLLWVQRRPHHTTSKTVTLPMTILSTYFFLFKLNLI